MQGISVIICCYNSSSRLPETLRYLAHQITEVSLAWEVILINNNSTDNTVQVGRQEWQKYAASAPLRVIDAPTPGLSAAREKGIEEAAYDFLIFCDDDNWLAPGYVQKAYELLQAHPRVAAIGGNNLGVYEAAPPDWLPFFAHSYAIGSQGEREFQLLDGYRYVVGAGMAFKKQAYYAVKEKGFGFYLTDRIGNKVIGGGDVELCFCFKLAGYDIAYSSELTLQHYMPAARMTKQYLIKMWHQYSQSWLVFEAYKVLLDKRQGEEVLSEAYWRSIALKRLSDKPSTLPRYIYHKLRGNIIYYLAKDADILYNAFLLRNTSKLIRIIRELQHKVTYE
ncbi:glycosyltransferase [Hymenobacter sp. NBH84]|uniref:glycosyltransferase n=1 Tax=Hymenobacter sp. NBH84 TaxID=2596915 RepID=UPI001627BC56|nr:glycosyltransferase [Hymenobacter sp. NBH84]